MYNTDTITPTILDISDLSKYFGTNCALEHINLQLAKGQIIGLLGPNGSGKTTLLKMINGLLTPTSGHILINGLHPSNHTKNIVSYLPDRTYINTKQTCEQLIDFFSSFYSDFDATRAYTLLVSLNIDPFVPINTFSKGTKEKIQLILVMSRDAQLYILDEPIAGVDPASRDYIIQTILDNFNPEATLLISTHLITDIEPILDHVLFLQQGHIILDGSAQEIREDKKQSINDLFKEVFKC